MQPGEAEAKLFDWNADFCSNDSWSDNEIKKALHCDIIVAADGTDDKSM